MTRLTFIGTRNGKPISIVWEDGALFGDLETCRWIHHLAALLEGQIVGSIGGPYSTSNHLADPYGARAIILSIFPDEVRQVGDLPARVAPPGAVQ
jgi:hypothetical protein